MAIMGVLAVSAWARPPHQTRAHLQWSPFIACMFFIASALLVLLGSAKCGGHTVLVGLA